MRIPLAFPLLFFVALSLADDSTAFGVEFHVAPNGNDDHPGTQSRPFATLGAARDAIRALKSQGTLDNPVNVWVQSGTYLQSTTFVLSREDSGTERAPIRYRAALEENVEFIGGQQVRAEQ
jgi:hypothetical protein